MMETSTHLSKTTFVITTSIFSTLALLTTFIRFALRLHHVRTLHLDDLVYTVSIFCLISAAAVIYPELHSIYSEPPSPGHFKVLNCLLWSSIYGIKATLLVSFKQSVGAICPCPVKLYYVGVCGAVFAFWAFTLGVPFMSDKDNIARILTYLSTAVDVLTWGLVFSLSIPTIILNRPLSIPQKFYVGGLVSLTLGMAILSILLSIYRHNSLDEPFQIFLLFLEGCIAIVTASSLAIGITLKEGHDAGKHLIQPSGREWAPGTLTRRAKRRQMKGVEELLDDGNNDADGDSVTGLRILVRGVTPEPPIKAITVDRNEAVICTREVVVKVQTEEELQKSDWDRITNPRWVDHKWEQRSYQSSLSGN